MNRRNHRCTPGIHDSQLDLLLRYALQALRRHFHMEVAFISHFKSEQRHFLYVEADKGFTPISEGSFDPLADTYCQRVLDGRLPELIANAQDNPEAMSLAATRALPIGAHLSVPIWINSTDVFGTLCCFSRTPRHPFTPEDAQTLHLYADFIGHAIGGALTDERQVSEVHTRVVDALDNNQFINVYQPIFDIEARRPVGYEMLTRFQAEPYRTPDKWFQEAGTVGLMKDLEVAVIRKALNDLNAFPPGTYLSFNVSPQTVQTGAVNALFEGHLLDRVVLEITEHDAIDDYAVIANTLAPLRCRGLRLAVDDAGAGYASFRHILRLKPELIKIDASLVSQIDEDIGVRALASAIVKFAAETGSKVIAEGVEATKELAVLKSLKVHLVQGFLLGHPTGLAALRAANFGLNGAWPVP